MSHTSVSGSDGSDNASIHSDRWSPTPPGSPSGATEPFVPAHPHLQALHDAISSKALPCASGVFNVLPEDLILYYGLDDPGSKGLGRIDFNDPDPTRVAHLSESCAPASFGRGQADVLDETYRRAGKLDRAHFAATFDPETSGLIHAIRNSVLEGHSGKALRVELHKLNVYGPGGFFKSHKDTPRAENMVASLVVVFPTTHEGGALVLRHEEREFTFDSGALLAQAEGPYIAYAAFYGDVDHEVEPVRSGYRVTLTYNLYLVDAVPSVVPEATAYELALKDAFHALLSDAEYLPKGGLVGFGLRHEYPVDILSIEQDWRKDRKHQQRVPVESLLGTLKGSDAILRKVCSDLGLKSTLRILYFEGENEEDEVVMGTAVPPLLNYNDDGSLVGEIAGNGDGVYVNAGKWYRPNVTVQWATRMRPVDVQKLRLPWISHGNEAMIQLAYCTLCLVVEIGRAESRIVSL